MTRWTTTLLFTAVLGLTVAHAQTSQIKRTFHWFFGDSCGIDFSSGTPVAVTTGVNSTLEGCSAISDTSGNLLFYTDGITVWDSTNTQMPNGFSLAGAWSSEQSAIIVPKPASNNIYYIFTTGAYAGIQGGNSGLAYSVIDMNLNGGLGDVTTKNTVLMDTATEHLGASFHQNNQDVWVVGHKYNSGAFYSFLVSSSGVSTTPVISNTGVFLEGYWSGDWGPTAVGGLKFASSGCRLVCTFPNKDTLQIFDFNNISGTISNPITIPNPFPWYACFSPNSKLIYLGCLNQNPFEERVYQFDLSSATLTGILASKTFLSNSTGSSATMQIGPDGKIYCTKWQDSNLAVINNPNVPGIGSNFVSNGLYLGGKRTLSGITNFIQSYFYKDSTELFCTQIDGIESVLVNSSINIYPNPFSTQTTLETSILLQNATLTVDNCFGQTVTQINNISGHTVIFHRDNLASGLYFIRLTQENKVIAVDKLVIVDN